MQRLDRELATQDDRHEHAEDPHGRRFGDRGDTAVDRAQHQKRDQSGHQDRLERLPFGLDLVVLPLLRGQRRSQLRVLQAPQQHVENVAAHQHQRRGDGCSEQIRDRLAGDQAVDDQHDRRRHHRAQRAAGTDHTDGKMLVIAQAQHLRQRQNPQQHDLAADDPRQRREEERHDHGLDRHAARQTPGKDPHGIEQIPGDAGSIQQRRHQHEHGHRDQRILGNEAVDTTGDQRQRHRPEPAEREAQRHQAGNERQRQTGNQQRKDGPDQQPGSRCDIHQTFSPRS